MKNDDLIVTINTTPTEVQEFRRFAWAHIYPNNIYKLRDIIKEDSKFINQQQLAIPLNSDTNNGAEFLQKITDMHNMINTAMVYFFNDPEIIKIFRNKIYNTITNEYAKKSLNNTLSQIQSGNSKYLELLVNITFLNDNVYIIL